jgi:hypothetical protein
MCSTAAVVRAGSELSSSAVAVAVTRTLIQPWYSNTAAA